MTMPARSTTTSTTKPAEPIREPSGVRELYTQAVADLDKMPKGAILRWAFWHANGVGRLEVARAVLKRFESRDWDIHARALAYMPGTSMYDAAMAARPEMDIKRAQDYVIECAAYVQAAETVLSLMRAL